MKNATDKLNKQEIGERKHFDKTAISYDTKYGYKNLFTKYKLSNKSKYFFEFVTKEQGDKTLRILEIGCGTGEYTKLIATALPKSKFVAIDVSEEILKIAQRKCKGLKNVSFATKSAYKTGYKSGSFDVVCGFYILHHLDISEVAKEIYRILKPGGIGFFYEPNVLNPYVFVVKSTPFFLKRRAGDSPGEWAVNPLTIRKSFSDFTVETELSEYILPLKLIPTNLIISLDKLLSFLAYFPLIKYLGGSVQVRLLKK